MKVQFSRIIAGIADYSKDSVLPDGVAFIRRIDYRSDPRRWTILPKTVKESASVITDLPVWADRVSDDAYIYGDTGNIYKRTLAGAVTLQHSVSNSHGNGLKYFGEDSFLYYTTDKAIGRYGPFFGTPNWVDDFLTAEGGVPLNTNSLDLESGSSQYATAADSASLSQTSDISIELWAKLESLPASAAELVLASKWNENANKRSYKLSVYGNPGFFGDGSDGALTISSNTTDTPIDSAATATYNSNTISATNASFAAGQRILLIQTQGASGTGDAGAWMITQIQAYTAGTITTVDPINTDYTSGSQVIVLKQYSSVTVNSGVTWTAKAWTGTVGGIIAFLCSGTVSIVGSISAAGRGFIGGTEGDGQPGLQGEASIDGTEIHSTAANGMGGGGGDDGDGAAAGGGAGGGHSSSGTNGQAGSRPGGTGGGTGGSADLNTMVFGGAGGGGGRRSSDSGHGGAGGNSGGIVLIGALTLTVSGSILANGSNGANASTSASHGGGGGGAGGSILLRADTATLGSSIIAATGGSGGAKGGGGGNGGAGSSGRIHLSYVTTYSGTTNPTLDVAQDSSFVGNVTYHLKFYVSSNGTNSETYSREITGLATGVYHHFAVTWDASASTAILYVDGSSIGTVVGALTAISDTTALFAVGADFNSAGTARSFFDGLIDEVRLWSDIRTTDELVNNMFNEIATNSANLVGYWQVDASASDSTANANNLTLVNTPVYSTTVPFSSPTTRLDIDQQDTSTGDTYALGTTVDEGASHRQTFVPAKDPQKSISVNISDTGDDSDWTLVVHDVQNRTVATSTVTHANLSTGVFEFTFTSVWTPVIGASYHFHIYATTTTGTPLIVAGTANNLETGQFKSYYQFLVTDTEFHPIEQIINVLAIGNGRYVATWDGGTYDPHAIVLPSNYKVRCLGKWREYLAIGTWRGSSVESNDDAVIFFWDGFSETYNFFIQVPEGAINAMLGHQGTLSFVAGYKGDLLEYTGGDKATKVKRLPNIGFGEQMEILPGAMSMWETLLRIGAGVTDSNTFEQGVYTWGSLNVNYPDSLSYDYTLSTGNSQNSNIKIGLLFPVDKSLLIGWKDGTSYGLDSVDPSGSPFADGSIEFMIHDEGSVWKEKDLLLVRADFESLISGQSVGVQYKLDRGSWSTEQVVTSSSSQTDRNRLQVKNGRHKEYQTRVNLYTSVSTSPAVLSVAVDEDLLETENTL